MPRQDPEWAVYLKFRRNTPHLAPERRPEAPTSIMPLALRHPTVVASPLFCLPFRHVAASWINARPLPPTSSGLRQTSRGRTFCYSGASPTSGPSFPSVCLPKEKSPSHVAYFPVFPCNQRFLVLRLGFRLCDLHTSPPRRGRRLDPFWWCQCAGQPAGRPLERRTVEDAHDHSHQYAATEEGPGPFC